MRSRDRGEAQIDPIDDQQIDEGTELSLTATVSGGSSVGLSFNLGVGAPVGAAIDSQTGLFTWTPSEIQGPDFFIVEVLLESDQGLIDSESFFVAVNELNRRPSWNPLVIWKLRPILF